MNYIKLLLFPAIMLLSSFHTQAKNNSSLTGNMAPSAIIYGPMKAGGQSFDAVVVFTEKVTGLTASDFQLSGVAGAIVSNVVINQQNNYIVTISYPVNSAGMLSVSLPVGTVTNLAGEANDASNIQKTDVNNVLPVVTSVIAPDARNYRTGDVMDFRVYFTQQILVSAIGGITPSLPITIGSRQIEAPFSGGIGDNSLFFSYTIQPGDKDLDGIDVGTSLTAVPHSMNDTYGNELIYTLAGIGNTNGVLVNSTNPLSSVTQLSGGSQVNGAFQIRVSFNEAVTGLTAASLALTNATASEPVAEDAFNYLMTITPVADGPVSVYLPADAVVNDGPNGNLISNVLDVTADVTIPTVTQLDVPAAGKYGTSSMLSFIVHFSENVNVNTRNGSPTLKLNIGGTVVDADFMGISGTNTWYFSYQIKDGDTDMDGIAIGTGISLNGATIRDGARNNANVTFPGNVDVSGITINTVRPTVVLSSNAPEWVNNPFTINADFSEAVTGITTSSFQVNTLIVDDVTTTDGIHYVLTVTPSYNGRVSISLPANKAQNQYSTGNAASDELIRTGDFVDPRILTLDLPPNGTYGINSTLAFTVHYNEIVLVNTTNGTPGIAINLDGNGTPKAVRALYSAGSGTDAITFSYTVKEGDMDLDGISLGAGIGFGGGGLMTDRAGNIARLQLPANNVSGIFLNTTRPSVTLSTTAPAILKDPFTITAVFSEVVTGLTAADFTLTNATASDLQVIDNFTYTMTITPSADGAVSIFLPANTVNSTLQNGNIASNQIAVTADLTAPVITQIDLPTDGYYKAGDKLTFLVHFSENVLINTANGNYFLPVKINAGDVPAYYGGVFSTNTMTFSYTIQNGDMAMNGISFTATLLGAGNETVRDASGNNADLSLPPNMDGSRIFINTMHPGVTLSTNAGAVVNAPFTITATFTEAITGFTAADFAATSANVSNLQPTDNITYTALVTPIATGPVAIALPADIAVNIGGNGNTAAATTLEVTADLTAPAVTQVTVPADGYYNTSHTLHFTVVYDEVVTVNTAGGAPALRVTVGVKNADAIYMGGSGTKVLSFAYAIQDGDTDMDGIMLGANLLLNGATIRDLANNDALLPLNNVGATTRVLVNTQHPSVTLSTPAPAIINHSFTVTAVFSEVVTGLTEATFSLQNATAASLQTIDGITYTLEITPAIDGQVSISLPADAASNIGQNGNQPSNMIQLAADFKQPVVAQIDLPAKGYYNATHTLVFTLHFSEKVVVNTTNGTPFMAVSMNNSTAPAYYTGGSGTDVLTFSYAIQEGDMDMDGISVSPAFSLGGGATIKDLVGNDANPVFNIPVDASGIFINTAHPGVVLSTLAGPIVKEPFTVTATFTEAVTGLATTDFVTNNATVSNLQITDQRTYTMLVTPVADGQVSITLPAAIVVNIAQNTNTVSNTIRLSASITPPLVVNQPPVLDVIPQQQICSTTDVQTLSLTGASPVEAGQTLSFFITADQPYFNTLTVSSTGLLSYSLKAGSSGAANITVTVKDNGGTANGGVDSLQRSFTLTIHPLPAISISSDKGTTTFKGDVILLTATGGNTYAWENADGIIGGKQDATLKVKLLANNTFQVAATDANGCSSSSKISISVNDDFKINATNILTPNGDGKNDKWVVSYLDAYPDNEVSIYDRAGRLVYQRRNYSGDWDGTMNGTPLAEGTYYYIINIKENNRVVKGYITLLRDK